MPEVKLKTAVLIHSEHECEEFQKILFKKGYCWSSSKNMEFKHLYAKTIYLNRNKKKDNYLTFSVSYEKNENYEIIDDYKKFFLTKQLELF